MTVFVALTKDNVVLLIRRMLQLPSQRVRQQCQRDLRLFTRHRSTPVKTARVTFVTTSTVSARRSILRQRLSQSPRKAMLMNGAIATFVTVRMDTNFETGPQILTWSVLQQGHRHQYQLRIQALATHAELANTIATKKMVCASKVLLMT